MRPSSCRTASRRRGARSATGFHRHASGVAAVLDEIERLSVGLGTLSRGRDAFHDPREGFSALMKLWPMVRNWRLSLGEMLQRHFGSNEAVKCALAANLAYYHDDPDALWWIFFAVAQGGYLQSGGRYIRGGSQRLSDALAGVVTAAGGEILVGRTATAIGLDASGAPTVGHALRPPGGDEAEAEAPIIVGNAAPQVLADMLPEPARERFLAPYARRSPSISLFSATFGLSVRPAELGIRAYSTFLLPRWMKTLAQYRDSARGHARAARRRGAGHDGRRLFAASSPASAGHPIRSPWSAPIASATGRTSTSRAYQDKRKRWSEAIIATIDQEFPGFASHVVASQFNTARSLADYLNAPHGAIYGFAPTPPSGPIWKGIDRSAENGNPGALPGVGLCRCRRLHRGDRGRGECGEPRSRAARDEEAVVAPEPLFSLENRLVARRRDHSQEPRRTLLERP